MASSYFITQLCMLDLNKQILKIEFIIAMIEINSLQSEGFEGQFYKIRYQRLTFLLFPPPDLSYLTAFNTSNQKSIGKTYIKLNLSSLLNYKHFFKEVNYVLLTDYKEMLLLPYFLRMAPEAIIISTNLTYQLARITLQTFQQTLADYDSTSQTPNFQKEGQILDQYEQKLQANFEVWRRLYSRQQVDNTLKKVIKVNYYQIFNSQRGVQLRAFPSGKNNGSCCWELYGTLTGEKILLVNQISQYNWRTCRSLDINRIKESHEQSAYNLVLFTKKAIEIKEGQQTKLAETIKKINSNAQSGISTTVVLDDDTLCVDLIPRLSTYPQGKIRGVLLKQQSYHSFHNYINSYVDYLSEHYRNQIFCQNPDYPLIHYSKIKQKGFLVVGSLQQAAVKSKLPLREIVSQCHPFAQFMSSYEFYLQSEQISSTFANIKHEFLQIKLHNNFNHAMLSNLLSAVPRARVVGFSEGFASIQSLQVGKKYNVGPEKRVVYHMAATNFQNKKYQKFTLSHNELAIQESNLQLIKIPRNWSGLLAQHLRERGVEIIQVGKQNVTSRKSVIILQGGCKVLVESSDGDELMLIQTWFGERGVRYFLS